MAKCDPEKRGFEQTEWTEATERASKTETRRNGGERNGHRQTTGAADAAARARRAIDRYPEDTSRPDDQTRLASSRYRSIARPGQWPGRHRHVSRHNANAAVVSSRSFGNVRPAGEDACDGARNGQRSRRSRRFTSFSVACSARLRVSVSPFLKLVPLSLSPPPPFTPSPPPPSPRSPLLPVFTAWHGLTREMSCAPGPSPAFDSRPGGFGGNCKARRWLRVCECRIQPEGCACSAALKISVCRS